MAIKEVGDSIVSIRKKSVLFIKNKMIRRGRCSVYTSIIHRNRVLRSGYSRRSTRGYEFPVKDCFTRYTIQYSCVHIPAHRHICVYCKLDLAASMFCWCNDDRILVAFERAALHLYSVSWIESACLVIWYGLDAHENAYTELHLYFIVMRNDFS